MTTLSESLNSDLSNNSNRSSRRNVLKSRNQSKKSLKKSIALKQMSKNLSKSKQKINKLDEDNENNLINQTNFRPDSKDCDLKHQLKRRRQTLNEKTNLNQYKTRSIDLITDDLISNNSTSLKSTEIELNQKKEIDSTANALSIENNKEVLNDNVIVPSWRILNFKTNYRLEKTENLNDETFLKRHQRHENEEKQIKRWDMRRQREKYERDKLLNGRLANTNQNEPNCSEDSKIINETCIIEIIDDNLVEEQTKTEPAIKESIQEISTKQSVSNRNRIRNAMRRTKARKTYKTILYQTKPALNSEPKLADSTHDNKSILSVYDFDLDSESNVFFDLNSSFNRKRNNLNKCLPRITV